MKNKIAFFALIVLFFLLALAVVTATVVLLKADNEEDSDVATDLDVVSIDARVEPDLKLADIGLRVDDYIRMDGATSTQPIRSLITCKAFDLECYWYQNEDGEMFMQFMPSAIVLQGYTDEQRNSLTTINSKTHQAYLNLIDNDTDLILVSTLPSEDEVAAAREQGVELEVSPIGMDAFIFIVNEENPIDAITTEQIKAIFSGELKEWNEIGDYDYEIAPYVRPVNSGSQELMRTLVMKDTPIDEFPEEEMIFETMFPLIEGVSTNPYAIGYTLFYYKLNMIDVGEPAPKVKVLDVDGVKVTEQTISESEYPYVFNIYAVTRKDLDHDSDAYKVKKWLTSKEGQQVIREAGYVKLYE